MEKTMAEGERGKEAAKIAAQAETERGHSLNTSQKEKKRKTEAAENKEREGKNRRTISAAKKRPYPHCLIRKKDDIFE